MAQCTDDCAVVGLELVWRVCRSDGQTAESKRNWSLAGTHDELGKSRRRRWALFQEDGGFCFFFGNRIFFFFQKSEIVGISFEWRWWLEKEASCWSCFSFLDSFGFEKIEFFLNINDQRWSFFCVTSFEFLFPRLFFVVFFWKSLSMLTSWAVVFARWKISYIFILLFSFPLFRSMFRGFGRRSFFGESNGGDECALHSERGRDGVRQTLHQQRFRLVAIQHFHPDWRRCEEKKIYCEKNSIFHIHLRALFLWRLLTILFCRHSISVFAAFCCCSERRSAERHVLVQPSQQSVCMREQLHFGPLEAAAQLFWIRRFRWIFYSFLLFVFSLFKDWGAVHSTVPSALAGLDVEVKRKERISFFPQNAAKMGGAEFFSDKLLDAVKSGQGDFLLVCVAVFSLSLKFLNHWSTTRLNGWCVFGFAHVKTGSSCSICHVFHWNLWQSKQRNAFHSCEFSRIWPIGFDFAFWVLLFHVFFFCSSKVQCWINGAGEKRRKFASSVSKQEAQDCFAGLNKSNGFFPL